MRKNFILDTNILLYDPQAIFHLDESRVLIPIEVIEEIDGFKHDVTERGRNSRTIAQILDDLRAKGRLGEGVPLGKNSVLQIVCDKVGNGPSPISANGQDRVANSVLAVARRCHKLHPDDETIVLTKNVHLRLKADVLGIIAKDYDVDRFPEADRYPGWIPLSLDAEAMARLRGGEKIRLRRLSANPNEYVFATLADDKKNAVMGRIDANGTDIIPLPPLPEHVVGIGPLNLEQTFVLHALLNDDVKLVTLAGKAGTGKTLLAVAAGLHKVFAEERYRRLLVFRPTMPVSRDIGFLPGDVSEKMRPWMQPVYDALELLREQDKRSKNRCLPHDIMNCEEISVEPVTYIRGRSIPHQYIIIDEAQNLTPLEIKTVITRVGIGTKIILTGDPHQIDNPYIDALSNGLSYLVEKFRTSPLAAHVCLIKGERSELAEAAANVL